MNEPTIPTEAYIAEPYLTSLNKTGGRGMKIHRVVNGVIAETLGAWEIPHSEGKELTHTRALFEALLPGFVEVLTRVLPEIAEKEKLAAAEAKAKGKS